MNILFYVEPLIEQDKPYWKSGWADVFSFNIVKTLEKTNKYNFLLITNEAIAQLIKIPIPIITLTQYELLKPFKTTNYLDVSKAWHCGEYNDQHIQEYSKLFKKKLADFVPDIIITFSPAPFLKDIFKSALLLHKEYGIFSRIPYPETWFLDPVGMHSNVFLNKYSSEISSVKLSARQEILLNSFKKKCSNIVVEKNPFAGIFSKLKAKFTYLVLLPLQVSRYYSFDDLVKFKSQYEYCVYILDNIPKHIGVVVNTHPEYPVLTNEAIRFLKFKYENFIYEDSFNSFYASGQLILPFVDAVVTVSSSVGLQTLIFDKKLITLSDKTFSFISDQIGIENIEETLHLENKNKDPYLYFFLTRHSVLKNYLHSEEWLDSFLHRSLNKFRTQGVTKDFYDIIDNEENIFKILNDYLDSNKQLLPQFALGVPYIQLYISSNSDYNEFNSFKLIVNRVTGTQTFEFQIDKSENISNLRIDPLNEPCVLEILNVYLTTEGDDEIDLKQNVRTNAKAVANNVYFFDTNDPVIAFENVNFYLLKIAKLVVVINYLYFSSEALLATLQNVVEEKNQIIQAKSLELNRVYSSKSWVYTRPIRYFVNLIRKII